MFAISGEGDQTSGNFPIVKTAPAVIPSRADEEGSHDIVRPKRDSSPSARLGMTFDRAFGVEPSLTGRPRPERGGYFKTPRQPLQPPVAPQFLSAAVSPVHSE